MIVDKINYFAMFRYPEAHGRGIALIVVRLLELAHKLLGEGLLGRFPPQNSGRLNWRPFFIYVVTDRYHSGCGHAGDHLQCQKYCI